MVQLEDIRLGTHIAQKLLRCFAVRTPGFAKDRFPFPLVLRFFEQVLKRSKLTDSVVVDDTLSFSLGGRHGGGVDARGE